jgi:PhnB protein
MTFVQPYLSLQGRTEEALEFYTRTMNAKVTALIRFKDSPASGDQSMMPPGSENKIMHAAFQVGDTTLLASDGECTGRAKFEGMTLALTLPDDESAERTFAELAKDGSVQMPLTETFFSSKFGMVSDRFGVPWMVLTAVKAGAI